MNIRRLLLLLAPLPLGLGLILNAADTAPANPQPAYKVVLDLHVTEVGTVEDATVVDSDDKSVDHILERIAMENARTTKLPPKMKDGKAVKFVARAPFLFKVEDDEGPAADNVPKPVLRNAIQPVYPAALAAKGEVGGAILELTVSANGFPTAVKALRSSHPEFEQAAIAAVNQWAFVPAKKDGVPVESRFRIALAFETDVLRADWKWRFPPRPALGSYSIVHRTLPDEPAAVPGAAAPAAPAPEKPAGK